MPPTVHAGLQTKSDGHVVHWYEMFDELTRRLEAQGRKPARMPFVVCAACVAGQQLKPMRSRPQPATLFGTGKRFENPLALCQRVIETA
jgi:hypothetical protein